ncbi:hypothetical protein AArc1_0098 [Natrarchaeobaculum sulfurireducens]|uniref:YkgJ family cysteine cluster protein n=1 Tax=Natrarchaeobaculum sulfurireducens TaxID=2044521 RepID=A0A346PAA7_9EURY|nr:hypothetical protein AArc1_0098 [Natrarchaeobaculum sulfurireducens]
MNCAGCAGCCIDWRGLLQPEANGGSDSPRTDGTAAPDGDDALTTTRQRGSLGTDDGSRRASIDDVANFVPLTREEVRAFLEAGYAAALTPRFWRVRDEHEAVTVDGYDLAAVADRPAFFVGLRKPPKPVTPFELEEPVWLPACVFLDPTTLQCRIHDDDLFPAECGAYPAHNLALEAETECERVEAAFGGERLLEADVEDEPVDLLLGSQAIGEKLFCHPEPDRLEGVIDRLARGEATREDRATCLAVAAASSPGTLAISEHHREQARERALEAASKTNDDAWVGPTIREWHRRRVQTDGTPSPTVASAVEEARGAPETPGWDDLE